MRLVKGRSLHQRLVAGDPLRPDEAGRIAAGVLEALSAAHDAGIVHRDVKPANIMIADDGMVLLADFGIAKHHTDTTQTSRGMLIGSLPYMSPDRLNGQDLAAGDMFALGATLYEMTEGTSPFARETPTAIITAVALEQPSPPRNAGHLGPLIQVLLNKDPAGRPDARAALHMLSTTDTETAAASAPARPKPQPGPVQPAIPSTVDMGPVATGLLSQGPSKPLRLAERNGIITNHVVKLGAAVLALLVATSIPIMRETWWDSNGSQVSQVTESFHFNRPLAFAASGISGVSTDSQIVPVGVIGTTVAIVVAVVLLLGLSHDAGRRAWSRGASAILGAWYAIVGLIAVVLLFRTLGAKFTADNPEYHVQSVYMPGGVALLFANCLILSAHVVTFKRLGKVSQPAAPQERV
jgi:serine/threonine protein kinase